MAAHSTTIVPCPSCGAALPGDGHCSYCGSQARGFWHTLDLGTPELATAVMQGLDYYLVLGALPQADSTTVAEAYRQVRSRFPDDPRWLVPQIARQLGIVEEAWRILGLPLRRELYDRLRSQHNQTGDEVRAIYCQQCGSPVDRTATKCPSCGSPRAVETGPVVERPIDDMPDYYGTLRISPKVMQRPTPMHQGRTMSRPLSGFGGISLSDLANTNSFDVIQPDHDDVELAYLARLKELAYHPDPEEEERVEVARQVLQDSSYFMMYEALREQFNDGHDLGRTLRALTSLDREVRAGLRGSNLKQVDGNALLDQGRGLMRLKLFSQAVPALEQACAALPTSAEAHLLYALALWGDGDVSALTPHTLRRAELTFAQAVELDASLATTLDPYIMVTHGLLCFNEGAKARAEELFAQAAAKHPSFFAAWRMWAAILLQMGRNDEALGACRKALKLNPRSEPVLLLALVACARQRQPERALELADRIAVLRGDGARAADVLRDVGLAIPS